MREEVDYKDCAGALVRCVSQPRLLEVPGILGEVEGEGGYLVHVRASTMVTVVTVQYYKL